MTSGSLAVVVIEDEPIEGVADRVARMPSDAEDDIATGDLVDGLAADRISLPTERGLPDLVRRIVGRLRGLQLVDDLGRVDSSFELLGLHVPPGGRAALEMRRSATVDRQISVTAMGLGFGGGRRFTIAMDDDIGERSGCMRVLQRVELHVRRFANEADGAEPIIRTDVVGWGARELTLLADCPFCGGVGEPGPLEYEQDLPQALDLRTFDGPVKRETSYSLDGSRKTDIGLSLAVPGAAETVHVGFQLEQQTRLECTATYSFPPGRFYVPYRSRDAPATLPYWAVR